MRPGRHGRGLQGARRVAAPPRRAQGDAPRRVDRRRDRGPAAARSPPRGRPRPPQHRSDLPGRRSRRHPLHRNEVHRGTSARRDHRGSGRPADRGGRRGAARHRERAGVRARTRHRPPRHQELQYPDRSGGARLRLRLRPRPRSRGFEGDAEWRCRGDTAVHEPRAMRGRARGAARRSVLARHRGIPNAGRRSAIRGELGVGRRPAPVLHAAAGPPQCAHRRPRCPADDHHTPGCEGSGAPLHQHLRPGHRPRGPAIPHRGTARRQRRPAAAGAGLSRPDRGNRGAAAVAGRP